jgi:hypothetical protein
VAVGETVTLGAAVECRIGEAVGAERLTGACGELGQTKVGIGVLIVGIVGYGEA